MVDRYNKLRRFIIEGSMDGSTSDRPIIATEQLL